MGDRFAGRTQAAGVFVCRQLGATTAEVLGF